MPCDSVSDMGGNSGGFNDGLDDVCGGWGDVPGCNSSQKAADAYGGNTSAAGGSNKTDSAKDDNKSPSRTDADKFQKELNKTPDESSPVKSKSRSSLPDLYGKTPKNNSSEEEEKQKEKAKLGDKSYRELVATNASPATHLDPLASALSVNGGPPRNVPSKPLPGYNHCGPSNLNAPPTTPLDGQCQAHDKAYGKANLTHKDVDLLNPGQDNVPGDQDKADDELCEFSRSNPELISPVVEHLFCDPEDYEEPAPEIWP